MKGEMRSAKSWVGPVAAGGGCCSSEVPVGLCRRWHSLMVPHTTFGSDWGAEGWGLEAAAPPSHPPRVSSLSILSFRWFVPGSRSILCSASPKTSIPNYAKTPTRGLPLHYQHLLAQLDQDKDPSVHHPLALDRPVLEGQVLAFLIQEDPQLFLGDRESVQGSVVLGGRSTSPAPRLC